MANKINLKEEKVAIQLPKSLRELNICLSTNEGVHQLIETVVAEKIASTSTNLTWCQREPLCLRELVRVVLFEERLRSAVAPLFAASLNNNLLQNALFEALSLSGKENHLVSPHLTESIEQIAAQPVVFFKLCQEALKIKNYQLLFQLTKYCAESPDFAKQSAEKIRNLIENVLSLDDPIVFADLLDKDLIRFFDISTSLSSKSENIDGIFYYIRGQCADLFVKRGLASGKKISPYPLENFGFDKKLHQPRGWDQILLCIAHGAIVDSPPRSPAYYASEDERKSYPFKVKAHQLASLRQKLYADEAFDNLQWLGDSEKECLYLWLNLDKQAAQVIKRYPDFFKELLFKMPLDKIDFSVVLLKYVEAGCFSPLEAGWLVFKAIDERAPQALVALKRAGVPFDKIDRTKRLNPFQYALDAYIKNLRSRFPSTAEEDKLRKVLETLIDCVGKECNQSFPSGEHPIEVLLGSDLEVFSRNGEARLSRKKTELLKKMLQKGVDLKSCGNLSFMRMIDSMVSQDIPVLNLLVSHGISLEEQNSDGQCVLHVLLNRCPDSLLGSGWLSLFNGLIFQDPKRFASVKDSKERTPLDLAVELNNSALVLLLLQWRVVPEGFSLKDMNLKKIDPLIRQILEMFIRKPFPSNPEELASSLTLKQIGNFFGDVILKEQRSTERGKRSLSDTPLEGQLEEEALEFLSVLLSMIGKDLNVKEKEKLQEVQESLKKVIPICQLLHRCALDNKFRVRHLGVVSSVIRSQIQQLNPGEALLLPAGWLGLDGKGHAMLVEIRRDQSALFSLKVMNTGSGIKNHAHRQTSLKNLVNPVRRFDRVTQEQLLHTAFIETLFAPLSYVPQDGPNGYIADDIYHLLFSRFQRNAAPLEEEKEGHFRTAQRSGTCATRVGLAYLDDTFGTNSYKKIKIMIDEVLFQALSQPSLLEKFWFDPVFIHLLEHTIRQSSLNLHKQLSDISAETAQTFAESIADMDQASELIRDVTDTYRFPERKVSADFDGMDPAQKMIASIDQAQSQFVDMDVDDSIAEPSPYVAPPLINFALLSPKEWIEGFDQLIDFFDESINNRSDPMRVVPTHLTTQAIATLSLPNAGVFHPEIDTNHCLGNLSFEDKTTLAQRIKSLAERYAMAFYNQKHNKGNLSKGEPELVEQYLCTNKLYAIYWRLMLHLEKEGKDHVSLKTYGIDISHLKALQNSIYLPTYSPHVAKELSELIFFFEASHPAKGSANKTLLAIGSWGITQNSYNESKLNLPLEGDFGEVSLFENYHEKIPPNNWSAVDKKRETMHLWSSETADKKQWRLAHMFAEPAQYTDSHLTAYQSLREMALICWSFKKATEVKFGIPQWSSKTKLIELGIRCEKKIVKAFSTIITEAKDPSALASTGRLLTTQEALQGDLEQNNYVINREQGLQHFYDIAHIEEFAVDRLLSYYEDHLGRLTYQDDRFFFQTLLFGKDRLKQVVERDEAVLNRLLHFIEQGLCEFELQLGASSSREDLLKTVMFLKALKLRVIEYVEEMGKKPSMTSQEVGADLQNWIEHLLEVQQTLPINLSELHLLWICAQHESAWKDPRTCLKALVALAQTESLENREKSKTVDQLIWKAWATKKLFSHVKQIEELFQDRQIFMEAAEQIASIYGISTHNLKIGGIFPQVIMRDDRHLYELNLLSGVVVRDQISLTNPVSDSLSTNERACFLGRKEEIVLYRVSSHKEKGRDRERHYLSCDGKNFFCNHFQNNSPEWHCQIFWERSNEMFAYVPFDTLPKEWKQITLIPPSKQGDYCFWMNTQTDSSVYVVIEHKATGHEEMIIYRDGSIHRLDRPGLFHLIDSKKKKESLSLTALQSKHQVTSWEQEGFEEIQCFGLRDQQEAPFAFSRYAGEEQFRCNNLPGYDLAKQQTVKGLGRYFPYAVVENGKGEKRAIIPVRGWSKVIKPSEEQNQLKGMLNVIKPFEEEKQSYSVEILPIDSNGQLSVLSVRQKLLLAYNFLGAKQYERALKFLLGAATSSVYTPEELHMFAWIFLHHQETGDHSPHAQALSLLAAHLVRQNLHTFPAAYMTSKPIDQITDLYEPPLVWVEFWKGRTTQLSGKAGESARNLCQELGKLLVAYYDVSSHCSGDFKIHDQYLNSFQEAEWLQEIVAHAPYPELIHRLQFLVAQIPDAVHMDSIQVVYAPKIPLENDEKRPFTWSFRSESMRIRLFGQAAPLEPILRELNPVRPETAFKTYFSELYSIARKGSKESREELLQFLRDMQYDPSHTNQILRAILISQIPPYNTYECIGDIGIANVSDRIAKVIESIVNDSTYESEKEEDLLPLLRKWCNHYFPETVSSSPQKTIPPLPNIATLLPPVSQQRTKKLPSPQFGVIDSSIPELNRLTAVYFDARVNESTPVSYPPLPQKMAKDPYFQMRSAQLREDIEYGAFLNASQITYTLKEGIDTESLNILKSSLVRNRNRLRQERKVLEAQVKNLVLNVSNDQKKLSAQLFRLGKKDVPPDLDECLALFVQADLDFKLYRKRLPFLSEDDCRLLHMKIGQFLQKATEEQRWERCLQRLAEGEMQALALEMDRVREYNPSQYPEFMVFEYYAQFGLRKEQVDNLIKMTTLDANGNFPSYLLQMVMGAGKTSVGGTLLALMKADGYHLSMLLTPRSSLETNALEMKDRNERFFGQRGDAITFNRGSSYFNVPYLRRLHNQLIETINNRRYVILVPETLLSMQNQYTEARERIHMLKAKQGLSLMEQRKQKEEIQQLQAAASELKKILDLIETRGAPTLDEVDTLHAARKELNYPGVNTENLDRISIDLIGALYKIASCDPKIKGFGLDLHANTQSRLVPDKMEQIKRLLSQKMVDAIIANPIWCQHLGLPVPCDVEKIADLNKYFSDPNYAAPEWMAALYNSSSESSRMGVERLTLLRQEILTWLPSCWKLSANEHFSRSKDHPEYLAAKPNISANTPNESAEIAHCWELVNKTLQLYVSYGADMSQAKIIIQSLQKLAVIQRNKIKVDKSVDPHTVIEQTEAAKLFRRLGVQDELMKIDIHDAAKMQRIHAILNGSKPEAFGLIIQYLTDHVFPELEFHTDQIDNNAMNLSSIDLSKQGYSGTIGNLYIFDHLFTQNPQETVILDKGAYGRVIDILCRFNRTLHEISSQVKTPREFMDAIHKTKPIKERDDFKAFIDIGAFFKGQTNLEIARSFLTYFSTLDHSPIQGILYYDDATNQLACLKKGEDKPIMIGPTDGKSIYAATSLSPDQLFTFYDQFHTTGANIIQTPDAQAFYTIGDQTLRDDLQGMMRMRGLLGGKQRLEGVVPEDLIPLIAHHIEQPIDGIPTIEQVLLFGEVNGLYGDAEDNVKVFLVKLQAAVRKYARSHLYQSKPEEEDAFYTTVRQFFVRSVKEELFLQYGGVSKKTTKEQYIADRLETYLKAIEQIKKLLPEKFAVSLEKELREIAAVANGYLPLEIDEQGTQDKTTVEKVLENKIDKLTEQEVQTQTALAARDWPKVAKERQWDFSSASALMQQLWSLQSPSLFDKPLMKRLSDVMADTVDLSLFSDCFSKNILMSANFLETELDNDHLLDKWQKSALEALIFFDQNKTPHLLLLSSKEAESFAQFIAKTNSPLLTLLNPKADVILGTASIDEQNIDIEQLRIQMLFFSGRFSSLEQDRWQHGLDTYLMTKRGLKRDLFEQVLLSSHQFPAYQNSGLALKLNAPSNIEESSSVSTVLKRAKFLFDQKRVTQCQALVDQHISAITETDQVSQLIDLARLNAAQKPADWAFSVFQKILLLIPGKKDLIDKLAVALASPMEQRIKHEIVGFILRQPDLSDSTLKATLHNAIGFRVDHTVEQQVIADKIEEMVLVLEASPSPEKALFHVSQILTQYLGDISSLVTRQTCHHIFEAIIDIASRSEFSQAQQSLFHSLITPYLEGYLKFIASECLRGRLIYSPEEEVEAIYKKFASHYYGHSAELDQLLENGLIKPLLEGANKGTWKARYDILCQVAIPYVQERAENLRLIFR